MASIEATAEVGNTTFLGSSLCLFARGVLLLSHALVQALNAGLAIVYRMNVQG